MAKIHAWALRCALLLPALATPPLRPPPKFDSCNQAASAGRFNINASLPDPFGSPLSLVEAVCCDKRNMQYAEPQNLYADPAIALFSHLSDPVTIFYDSASGIPLFRAPVNRTLADFEADTKEHGWPSFRAAEVIANHVIVSGGLVASATGTHLGSYLPDDKGPRWCIDLSCISGMPPPVKR